MGYSYFCQKVSMAYDYIFCGFGLATMLVIDGLAGQDLLKGKSLLIIEKELRHPEQTWCFWETGPGKWDSLLSGQWKSGFFEARGDRREILGGASYKSMAAETLRKYVLGLLEDCHCTFRHEQVVNWIDDGDGVSVCTEQSVYTAKLFFNSAYKEGSALKSRLLLQHFEGWYIEARAMPFAPGEATIMDFTVAQKGNTRFMYVLPFSATEALVEYTLFSPGLIPKEEYGEEIAKYLQGKGVVDYQVRKKETGVVPMTAHPFWEKNTRNVLHIGTAGGWTKASTGYTFSNGIRMARRVADAVRRGSTDFSKFHRHTRFRWYDELLIDVLYHENAIGEELFRMLFSKGNPPDVMRFLDEETGLADELGIILRCPKKPFLFALWRTLFKK